MSESFKGKVLQYYQKHETRFHIGFFLAGFCFDVVMAGEIDDLFMLGQQFVYLFLIGLILTLEHLVESGSLQITRLQKMWQYRSLFLHFALGTILNLYSIFFLKSSSVFNSMIFVIVLLALIIANELPRVQKSGVNVKWALWVLCLFAFFTVIYPLILGFVGWLPFLLAAVSTVGILYLHFRVMMKRQKNFRDLSRAFLEPGLAVVSVFVGLYFLRLIPPVPLSVHNMGVYHQLDKRDGKFILSHENPWWKLWQSGDQVFKARSGDQIFFFAQIFSPARFSDEVIIHWLYKDPRAGWMTSDQVRMKITGGRENGFRGYSVKKNYSEGQWRVQVETTDGREIGRLYVQVEKDEGTEQRVFEVEEF
jgi:hypothetical protein